MRLTMSPRTENVATTGMGSSAHEELGMPSVSATAAVIDVRIEEEECIIVLGNLNFLTWQGLHNCATHWAENK